ncbi:MAG: LacI family transcriptional regulator [Chloroflexota bacterium]|nr:LacI family transcriptional regulator [Chloroflexota bacterium]
MTGEDGALPPITRPTIRDVAAAAGVTVGTASRALNGRGQLRTETRDRVWAAAERLDFRPNDLIRSLQRGRTYTVGLLTADQQGRFSIPLLTGVEDALGAAEILVFLCNVRGDPERERTAIASLLAKQVDGVIVMGNRTDPRPAVDVGRSRVPVVYAYTQVPGPDALCLLPDDAQGAALAAEHLARLGRRRIAHVSGPGHWTAVRQRRVAAAVVLSQHGLDLPERRVLLGRWSEGWGFEAIDRLLEREPGIDAVFCGSDQIARGVLDGLRERGRNVPDDVALVGFDNWEILAASARPPLTTVDMNLHDLGQEAARCLLAMVAGAQEKGVRCLPCSLVLRDSCGGRR